MQLNHSNDGVISSVLKNIEEDISQDSTNDILLATNEEDIEIDDSFSLDGFQVVRREFFAHTFEPSISMQDNKIGFNTAAIRRMPDTDYVQFLVNSQTKTLAIMPCNENAPDSLMWCSNSNGKRKPRQVSGRFFFLKITALMDWNPDNRYKILGKMIRTNGQNLYVFKLEDVEQYKREKLEGDKYKTTRTPIYPSDWKNQFGVPYEQHRASLQINILDGFAVMGIKEKVKEVIETDMPQDTNSVPVTGGEHVNE